MTEADQRALIVVDVQPTFCEGGALPVAGGNAVAERIATFADANRQAYALVATTQDWHIDPGDHFSDTPDYVDTWPPHGIAGTAEAELHPSLAGLDADIAVRKGQYAAAYSGFEGVTTADGVGTTGAGAQDAGSTGEAIDGEPARPGATLHEALAARGITTLDVVGLAESHCVKQTALDGRALGYEVRVLTDLTEPVSPEQGEKARAEMSAAGVRLEASSSA